MAGDRTEGSREDEDSEDPPTSFSKLKENLGIQSGSTTINESDSFSGGSDESVPVDQESYLADLVSEISTRGGESSWDEVDHGTDWDEGRLLPDSKSEAIIELLGDTSNVLVLGPLLCPADYEVGTTLMRIDPSHPVNLLLVTFSQTPDERLSVCRAYVDKIPEHTAIVAVGGFSRSSRSTTIETAEGTVRVETVPDPADLKRIGITMDKVLNRWNDSGRQTIVCFHSLTALLQFVDDTQRIFRFLSILRSRILNSNAHAHYHMERGVHDEQLVGTLRSLFDAVVTYDDNGSVSIDS